MRRRIQLLGLAGGIIVGSVAVGGNSALADTKCTNLKHTHWTHADNQDPIVWGVGGWPYTYAISRGQYLPGFIHQHETDACPNGTSN